MKIENLDIGKTTGLSDKAVENLKNIVRLANGNFTEDEVNKMRDNDLINRINKRNLLKGIG